VYHEPHHFDPSERSYIVALADQCVQALHRARLSERLESTLDRLKSAQDLTAALSAAATPADVANAVSHAGLVATGASTAYLFWRRCDDGLELIQDQSDSQSFGDGPRFVEARRVAREAHLPITEAERSGAPVWSDTSAALPLAVNGDIVGVFGLGYAHARSFEPDDRTFLVGISTQCAQALHRAMLFRAEAESRRRAEAAEQIAKRTVARLTLAGEIADALADVNTEAEAARVVFDKAAEVLGAVAGMVTRRTIDDELEVVHVFGRPEDAPGPSNRLDGQSPHAEVFRTRRPLWLMPGGQDLSSLLEVERPLRPRDGTGWIAVPLSLHGELSGTLSLTISSMPADDEARASLLRLVEQCGRALSRARLAESERNARRAAQTAEVETRRLGKLQEQFVAVVAHDLRTPLNAIQLTVSTLFAGGEPSEAQSRKAGRVLASVARIAEILRTLCDFSQARLAGGIPLETERVDLGRLVRRAVAEMEAAHPGRTIEASLDGDLAIMGDGGRLLQVLSNLLGNAIQHGSSGRPVTVGARGEGAAIVIDVHNEGPPIPPALLPSLFEPFRQGEESHQRARQTGSMGLGLFIVHEIVHAHGGMVSVDSRPERGTTFMVVVPRFPNHPSAGQALAPSGGGEGR
jgi:signal transduction histidine kinase